MRAHAHPSNRVVRHGCRNRHTHTKGEGGESRGQRYREDSDIKGAAMPNVADDSCDAYTNTTSTLTRHTHTPTLARSGQTVATGADARRRKSESRKARAGGGGGSEHEHRETGASTNTGRRAPSERRPQEHTQTRRGRRGTREARRDVHE